MRHAQIPSSVGFAPTSGTVRPLTPKERKAQIKAIARLWHIPYREMVELMADQKNA
jgi:hypothetical protein